MRAMRLLAILTILLSTAFIGACAPAPDVRDGILLVSADEAAIGAPPQQVTIADHYGDPAGFMKYIIRKPPVLA